MKNPKQEHQIPVIKRAKKSLKDNGGEKQEPVSEFNGYQYEEEKKKISLRATTQGRGGAFPVLFLLDRPGGFIWRRKGTLDPLPPIRHPGSRTSKKRRVGYWTPFT